MTVPIPYENKAQLLYGPRDLRLVSQPLPPPAADEVQVAIRSTTLCGSDVHYYTHYANGDIKIREPLSQGHEAAGEVVAVGRDVANLRVGDRVALEVGVPCGRGSSSNSNGNSGGIANGNGQHANGNGKATEANGGVEAGEDEGHEEETCEYACATGRYNLCPRMRFRSSAASFPHFQGTLRERVNHPARWCHPLPDSLSWDAGALLEPLSVAVHAVRKATLQPGASVLIVGAGAVGLMCAAAARAAGCADVTMTDIAESRLRFAVENGFAEATCSPAPPSQQPQAPRNGDSGPPSIQEKLAAAQENAARAVEAKKKATGKGGKFHATFECTGVESCAQTSLYATQPGGRVLLIGLGTPIETLPVSVVIQQEVDLMGVWRYANTYPKALEIMQESAQAGSRVPDLRKLLTHRFHGLEAVPDAFSMAMRTSDDKGNVVIKVVVANE